MKAILCSKDNIEFSEVASPILDDKLNVLVEVKAVGLCGSDVQRIDAINSSEIGDHPILGHEISGVVREIYHPDPTVTLVPGDRVAIEPIIYCQHCKFCLAGNFQFCQHVVALGKNVNGGFAELVAVREANLHKLPNNSDFDTATLLDPLAVVAHIKNLAQGFKGKDVAVIGDGTIGLLSSLIATHAEAHSVVVFGKRARTGYSIVRYDDNEKLSEYNDTFDIVIETVGRRNLTTINQAIGLCKTKGQIIVGGVFAPNFSLPINVRQLFFKEIAMQGSNSFAMNPHTHWSESVEAMNYLSLYSNQLHEIITHKYKLSDFGRGLETFRNKDVSGAIKVVFNP